jgi:hypothetical protein
MDNESYKQSCPDYKIPNMLSTLEIIEKIQNDTEFKDYATLSCNDNLSWEIVKNNPDKPWDYSIMSMNKNITWQIVKDSSPGINWDWEMLSDNPSILELSENDVEFLTMVQFIQKRWRDALYNPKYAICRKRILREFNELGEI